MTLPRSDDGRRATQRQLALLALPLVVLAAIGIGYAVQHGGGSSNSTDARPVGQLPATSVPKLSARTLLARSKRAAIASRWVGVTAVDLIGHATLTMLGNAGPTSGQQVLSFAGMTGAERVVGSSSYVDSPAELLHLFAGLSKAEAARVSGRWVEFQKGDPGYKSITAGMTVRSTFAEFSLNRPRLVGTQEENGVQAIGIASQFRKSAHKSETLWVSAADDHLPVRYEAREILHGIPATTVINFGNWGKAIPLTRPPGAIPFGQTRPAGA